MLSGASSMKRLSALLIIIITTLSSFAQEAHLSPLKKHDALAGGGIGSKSPFGNWGFTSNFFITDNFNAKLAAGGGQFNYNGFMVSLGPEFCTKIAERYYILAGSVWTVASGESKVIKNDNNEMREYKTAGMHYLRSYAGVAYDLKGALLKIECGYSYALKTPTYTLYNIWTPGQIEKLRNGMDSGLLVSISVQGIFHVGKKVY